MKKFKITETKQQVAVDILTELEVWMMGLPGNSEPTKSEQDIIDIYNKMYKKYGLNNDPFTLMCCTDREYQKKDIILLIMRKVTMRQLTTNLPQNMKLNTTVSVMVQKIENLVIVAGIGAGVISRGEL